jgi:hypothetical protein
MNINLISVIPTGVRPPASGDRTEWRNLLFPRALRCILIAVLFSAAAVPQDLPQGWRRPTTSEVSDKWRAKAPTRFVTVKADFDGDGKADTAELLVNPSRHRFAVFVKLGSNETWQRIGDEIEVKWLGEMGINIAKPGKYETACGKGYDDSFCAHSEPNYLTPPLRELTCLLRKVLTASSIGIRRKISFELFK